jgi:hypothetical protein
MGKKAKRNHTSEQPPLDDDVHWMPLLEAVALLIKQTASMRLALPDLEDAMESSKLPSMRRDLATREREPLQPEFWKANIIYYEETGRPYVRVIPGPKDERRWSIWASDPRDEDGSHFYFVSRSDFELLWSASHDRDGWQVARLKTVLPIVYPDGVPADAPDLAVQRQLVHEYEKRDWKLPSDDTIGRFRRPK